MTGITGTAAPPEDDDDDLQRMGGPATMSIHTAQQQPHPGHRRSHRLLLPVSAAAAVLAAVAIGWAVIRPGSVPASPWPPAPSGGPFLPWPAAGNAITDRDLVTRAGQAWDAGAGTSGAGPHTDVRPLLIQTRTPAGPVVILQGNDHGGAARLAIITGRTDAPDDASLYVRADRPAPDPAATRQISLVTARLTAQVGVALGAGKPVVAVVLAAPGTDAVRLSSTVSPRPDAASTRGRIAVATLDHQASAFSTTITGTTGSRTWSVAADDDAIGESRAHPVQSMPADQPGYVRIRIPAEYSSPSRQPLVTSRRGVVGKVDTFEVAADGTVAVELISHPGFSLGATTPDDQIALVRTTPAGLELVNGSRPPRPGDIVLAGQSVGPAPGDEILLPLAVATTRTPTADPNATGLQWSESTTPLDPVADPGSTDPLYLIGSAAAPVN